MVRTSEYVPSEAKGFSDEELQSLLRDALSLPSQKRRVADWLFGARGEDCKKSSPTISPAGFEAALSLVSETRTIPSKNDSSNSSCYSVDGEGENTNKTFMVFVPVEQKDGVTLGYTFQIGVPFRQGLFPFRDVLRSTYALEGKFAFDTSSSELLLHVENITASGSIYCRCKWTDVTRKDNFFFSLPNQEYGFCRLPSRCLGVTIYRQIKIPIGISETTESGSPHAHADTAPVKAATDKTRQVSSNLDPTAKWDSGSADCVSRVWGADEVTQLDIQLLDNFECTEHKNSNIYGSEIHPQSNDSDPLEMRFEDFSMLRSASLTSLDLDTGSTKKMVQSRTEKLVSVADRIESIGLCLFGNFRASVRRFMGRPALGHREEPVEVLMHSMTRPVDEKEGRILKKLAARSYFADALCVTPDMRLTVRHDGYHERDSDLSSTTALDLRAEDKLDVMECG